MILQVSGSGCVDVTLMDQSKFLHISGTSATAIFRNIYHHTALQRKLLE